MPAFLATVAKNPAYMGDIVLGRTRGGRFHWIGKDGRITSDRDEPVDYIVSKDAHPALIDRKTFARVTAKMKTRAIEGRRERFSHFPLSGLLVCGHCGMRLYGNTTAQTPKKIRRYLCNGANQGVCRGYSVSADEIEDFAIGWIIGELQGPSKKRLEAAVRDKVEGRANDQPAATQRLRTALAKVKADIKRGGDNLMRADEELVPQLNKTLVAWHKQLKSLTAELKAAEGKTKKESSDPATLAARATSLLDSVLADLSGQDRPRLKMALRLVYSEIKLWFEAKQPSLPKKSTRGQRWRLSRGLFVFKTPETPHDGDEQGAGYASQVLGNSARTNQRVPHRRGGPRYTIQRPPGATVPAI